jgi:hypothetical protein
MSFPALAKLSGDGSGAGPENPLRFIPVIPQRLLLASPAKLILA